MEMEGRKKQRNLHIPDDIIFNILRRLPPKSLAKFKCVCKSWQSFANQHKYHNQKLILLSSKTIQSIDYEGDEIKAVDLDIPFKVGNLMLEIASCNGLLCILIEREGLVIWNPLIGRYKRVSYIQPNPPEYNGFGFWYDHSSDNYKIVRFVRILDRFSVEIYSQKSNSWQQKEILPRQNLNILDYSFSHLSIWQIGVLVNEALYWKITCINNDEEVIHAVLCFDTLNEKFDVIPSPDNVRAYDLGVFKGLLCLFDHREAGRIEMWTREVGKNQNWIKYMNLSRLDITIPICSVKEDEILAGAEQSFISLSEGQGIEEEILLYSHEAKTYKKFHIGDTMKDLIQEVTYIDSFVSP